MTAILTRRVFRYPSGLLARQVRVDITLPGSTTILQTDYTDEIGAVDVYLEPGNYDFRFSNYIVPVQVLVPEGAAIDLTAYATIAYVDQQDLHLDMQDLATLVRNRLV